MWTTPAHPYPETLSSPSTATRTVTEKKIVDALKENRYSSSFICKHLCSTKHRQDVEVRRPRTTVTLPYINGLSEAVRQILTQLDIKVVFRPLSTLCHMLVHPNAKTQYHWTNRRGLCTPYLVTDVPRYTLDRLAKPFRHRLAEHQQTLRNSDVDASAPAEHTLDMGHPLDLTKAEVIDWLVISAREP